MKMQKEETVITMPKTRDIPLPIHDHSLSKSQQNRQYKFCLTNFQKNLLFPSAPIEAPKRMESIEARDFKADGSFSCKLDSILNKEKKSFLYMPISAKKANEKMQKAVQERESMDPVGYESSLFSEILNKPTDNFPHTRETLQNSIFVSDSLYVTRELFAPGSR